MLNIQVSKQLNEAEENYVEARWYSTCEAYQIKVVQAASIFDQIYFEYTDWSRSYHNLSHLWSLLQLSEQYQNQLESPSTVDLAIFFHDYIYNAKRKDNEAQSAQWANTLLSGLLPPKVLNKVSTLILSTAGHRPRLLEDEDQLWFLDFDLAILAAVPAVYKAYADAIREEYKSWYSYFVYNSGRKKILKTFLKRKVLYFTPEFQRNYETIARNNVAWEIKGLKEG